MTITETPHIVVVPLRINFSIHYLKLFDERSVISISLLVPFLAHTRDPENGEIRNNQDKHSVCFITGAAVEEKSFQFKNMCNFTMEMRWLLIKFN